MIKVQFLNFGWTGRYRKRLVRKG